MSEPNETAYRINHTPEGWTVEGEGTLWEGTYPSLEDAWDAVLQVEAAIAKLTQ